MAKRARCVLARVIRSSLRRYSSLGTSGVNIPGLTSAGSSSSLSSLLSSLQGTTTQIPQVEYQDLGLTLKATPKVMRSGDVALTLDMKLTALAGQVVSNIPVLNNRSFSGVVTLKEGSAVVVAGELDESESRALSGTPGVTEIPGLNNLTSNNTQKDYATLLIIMTPHVIRGPQAVRPFAHVPHRTRPAGPVKNSLTLFRCDAKRMPPVMRARQSGCDDRGLAL